MNYSVNHFIVDFLYENYKVGIKKLIKNSKPDLSHNFFFLHEFKFYKKFIIIFRKTKAIPKKNNLFECKNKELSIVVELIKISVEVLLNIIR